MSSGEAQDTQWFVNSKPTLSATPPLLGRHGITLNLEALGTKELGP